jgi:hypothetical protein
MGTYTLDPDTGNTTPDPRPEADPGDLPNPPRPNPDAATWVLDATTIRSTDQAEQHSPQPGDELYIARVAFRSTAGERGTTSAYFLGGVSRQTVIKHVHEGESHSIPDEMGKVSFPNVVLRGLADAQAGDGPDVLGTVDVLFADDNTPKGAISDLMRELAGTLRAQLADIIEPLDLLDLDAGALTDQIDAAMTAIESAMMPTVGQAIGLFLGSFFNPDKLIGFRVNLFVAVDDSLAPAVDAAVGAVLPTSVGTAGSLRPRTYSHAYAGNRGAWTVSHAVTSS